MSEVTWEITSLSELGTFSRGKSKHRPRNDIKLFEGGTYPLVQTGDVKAANLYITKNDSYYNDFGLKQSKLWPAGTLCITIAANIAETAILSYPMCFPDSIVGFNANPEKSSELFVYYFFEYIKKEIQKSASGSIQDNINIDYLSKMRIKVPEKKYQDKIVEVLSSIDKKILLNNQINQELEAMAKTLYDYWFVQFDFPDQNGKPYKSSGGKMVYHPELKREIPEGWGVEKLGDVSQYVSEKVDSSELNIENYVGTDNMIADMGGIELTTSIPKSGTSTKFSVGDILISNIRPYFKKIWLSDRTGGCSADVLCIRTDRMIPKEFVYATLARDDFFNYDVAGSKGSKMPRGDKKHIMEYPIVFEFGVAEQYSKIVRPIYEAVHENNNQNQELTKLRDWLLPMLMNGQVKVE